MARNSQVLIKKYSNRRLYDTSTSTYINLSDICVLVKKNEDFIVIDAKTEKDITRTILVQIILDYEIKGYELLPVDFLNNVIRFYDAGSKDAAIHFLDNSKKFFSKYQENAALFDSNLSDDFAGNNVMEEINNLTQKNMDFFFNLMSGKNKPEAKEEVKEKSPDEKETV
jgi:polyhydroxyalkanoate synthesis repressor PhaR